MKKRGAATLWFWVELIASILVVYIAVDVALANCQGTNFEKRNIARDISMQINTLSSLPGEGYIINDNLHGYSLRFFNNRVEVYKDITDQLKVTSYFVKIGDYDLNLILDKPEQIVISKIDDEIRISETIPSLS